MRSVVFIIALALLGAGPLLPWSFASGGEKPSPKYEDARLGELKDESDRFKFVRVKLSPMYPGSCLGDTPCMEWSHDYPEAGLHFSKILSELSKLNVVLDENEFIFGFDDPNDSPTRRGRSRTLPERQARAWPQRLVLRESASLARRGARLPRNRRFHHR